MMSKQHHLKKYITRGGGWFERLFSGYAACVEVHEKLSMLKVAQDSSVSRYHKPGIQIVTLLAYGSSSLNSLKMYIAYFHKKNIYLTKTKERPKYFNYVSLAYKSRMQCKIKILNTKLPNLIK